MQLEKIKYEMLTHVPVCTHAQPKKVLIIGEDSKVDEQLALYKDIETTTVENSSDALAKLDEKSFDIAIITDKSNLNERLFIGLLHKVITPKGVISTLSSNMFGEQDAFEAELRALGELFKIVMPCRYEDSELKMQNLLIASNGYHPTADINLQRADLTEGYEYYNSDIAIGAFMLPTHICKRFLGLVKL
ncbi:MAG: hypothetical protein JXQ76_09515 [Campylobacterales bacterium]|nr:hypothetical protein [Campylobacterales bacterium]